VTALDKIDITRQSTYEKLARQAEDADAIDAGHKLGTKTCYMGSHAEFRTSGTPPVPEGQRFIIAFEILTLRHACHVGSPK